MKYRLALYYPGDPPELVAAVVSDTPFHAVAAGQKIWLPPRPAVTILDVAHEIGKDNAGELWCEMNAVVQRP